MGSRSVRWIRTLQSHCLGFLTSGILFGLNCFHFLRETQMFDIWFYENVVMKTLDNIWRFPVRFRQRVKQSNYLERFFERKIYIEVKKKQKNKHWSLVQCQLNDKKTWALRQTGDLHSKHNYNITLRHIYMFTIRIKKQKIIIILNINNRKKELSGFSPNPCQGRCCRFASAKTTNYYYPIWYNVFSLTKS